MAQWANKADPEPLLTVSVTKNIGDKTYERRKVAALEVEQLLKITVQQGDRERIRQVLKVLREQYAQSPQPNFRKGGLLCLAAAVVGLGHTSKDWLHMIVPVVMNSITDQDSRVRYYACEALYNIAKISREGFKPYLADCFDALFRLSADSESVVTSAATFLDNLTKEIVASEPEYDITPFITKIAESLSVPNPAKKMFLLSWIQVLQNVPDIDMLQHLPQLLEGVMNMLEESVKEIRDAANKTLSEFKVEIQSSHLPSHAWLTMTKALVQKAKASDETVRSVALTWLQVFVLQAKEVLVPSYADILGAVLPNLSHEKREVAKLAREINEELLRLLRQLAGSNLLDTQATLEMLSSQLKSRQEPTRLEALHWVNILLSRSRAELIARLPVLLPALLDSLKGTEQVALEALSVLASIMSDREHFTSVLRQLLDRFRGRAGARLLKKRFVLIVQKLSAPLGAQEVFKALADILNEEQHLQFASSMVQALNLILLTAPEVQEMRNLLKKAITDTSGAGANLFLALYPCWTHSLGAMLSLCFLAQAYSHALELVNIFEELPVGVGMLVQVDWLVNLLETPNFTFLRLQLLKPDVYPDLIRCMYGLLMLLPQSDAFKILHARLHAVPTMSLLSLRKRESDPPTPPDIGGGGTKSLQDVDFAPLLQLFIERQMKHARDEELRAVEQVREGNGHHSGWAGPDDDSDSSDDEESGRVGPPAVTGLARESVISTASQWSAGRSVQQPLGR